MRAGAVALCYDPLGRLAALTGGGVERAFLYDGDALVAEYGAGGGLRDAYIHGPGADEPLLWYHAGGAARWLHRDHEGSIVAVTAGGSGLLRRILRYDEHGIPGAGNIGRFQFTGQAWLRELGLYHYKARAYSPTLGRFLQTDPVGYRDQLNLYKYVGDDPVKQRDPSGLEAACITLNTGCGMSNAGNGLSLSRAIEAAGYIIGGIEIVAGGGPEDPVGDAVAAGTIREAETLSAEARAAERGVGPGPYARESVPAGPGRRPSPSQQAEINRIGGEHGCHSCGTKQPGTKSGNFIGDHQPPTKLNPPGGSQRYHPHCQSCSNIQGRRVSQIDRSRVASPPPPAPNHVKPWWKIW